MFRRGICQCENQRATPKPPKQCQELKGEMCKHGEDCGVGGHCRFFE